MNTGATLRRQINKCRPAVLLAVLAAAILSACLFFPQSAYAAKVKTKFKAGGSVTVPAEQTKKAKKDGVLIIMGASRVKEMSQHVRAAGMKTVTDKEGVIWKTVYIAKSGEGYSWLSKKAYPKLKAQLKKYPCSTVVLQFGNNDLNRTSSGNIKKYISFYRKLMKMYPRATFYFMDILPSKNSPSMNARRRTFNGKLAKAFPNNYIGGYSYLIKSGFKTSYNSVHYSASTSKKIFRYILKKTGFSS